MGAKMVTYRNDSDRHVKVTLGSRPGQAPTVYEAGPGEFFEGPEAYAHVFAREAGGVRLAEPGEREAAPAKAKAEAAALAKFKAEAEAKAKAEAEAKAKAEAEAKAKAEAEAKAGELPGVVIPPPEKKGK